jgi:transcriptional regulator with XRE-family HTH domain
VAGLPDDRPAWAERLRQERVIRGWSQAEAVRALRVHFPGDQTGDASLLHAWQRWEAGLSQPTDPYKQALARAFGTVTAAFFPAANAQPKPPDHLGTLEILARMRSPGLDARTLAGLTAKVDELCCRYSLVPAEHVLPVAWKWQQRIGELLGHRLTLDQHREVLRLAGLLALLVGCLEWDRGSTTRAEASRRKALSLGEESGSTDVSGWADELRAWFALTQGDYRTVIAAGERGQAIAVGQPVRVQLAAQTARAWARIGERRQTEVALDQARRLLEPLPVPANPGNHFDVDPSRFDLWAMDCYRVLGEDRLAAGYAREVLRTAGSPTGAAGAGATGAGAAGRARSPMRVAEAELTLGVVAARSGDVEAAVHHGKSALGGDRVSLPALLMTSRELARLLARDFAGSAEATAYAQEVQRLESQALGPVRPGEWA